MADLTDEQLRALRLLARYPSGCPGAVLLEQGFSYDQLSDLVLDGLAKLQPSIAAKAASSGRRSPRRDGRQSRGDRGSNGHLRPRDTPFRLHLLQGRRPQEGETMADEEHIERLQQAVLKWHEWQAAPA